MKKYISATLAMILAVSLCACNKNEGNNNGQQDIAAEETTEAANEETTENITENTTENTTEEMPSFNTSGLDNTKYGWYYMAQGEHKQPNPPNEHSIDFAKYKTYYVGDSKDKVIYLTFDEGYENGYTEQILDTLKEKNVPAAFFITQYFIEQRSDLVMRMVNEGHIVGNHSVNHLSSPELSEAEFNSEINDLASYYKEVIGQDMPHYFRPPRGEYSEKTLAMANNLGYKNIFWSFAHRDWLVDDQPSEEDAYKKIVDSAHNGEIMLLHAVSKTNTDILGKAIDELRAEGYEFKSLDELK